MPTINGTPDNDTLTGSAGNDEIFGQEGVDNISGGAGDDTLSSGPGAQGGYQYLYGDDGNDSLVGGDSRDVLNGGADNDVLLGGGGSDTLYGGAGDDVVDAGTGDDYVADYEGNDVVDLGAGTDYAEYVSYQPGVTVFTGGTGIDTYHVYGDVATAPASNDVDIITDFATGVGGDVLQLDSALNDLIDWNEALNPFVSGHFRLVARDLDGDGVADDTALMIDRDGSAGGGAAVDMLYLLNVLPGSFTIDNTSRYGNYGGWNPSGAPNVVVLTERTGGTNAWYGTSNDDVVTGGYDRYVISGREGNDSITGGELGSQLSGDAGNDTLTGRGEDDSLQGGEGNDSLTGGDGTDYLYGDGGSDTLGGGEGSDYLDGGDGDDTIVGGNGDDTIADYYGNNVIDGGAGDDLFQAVGNFDDGTDTLTGGTGRDTYRLQWNLGYDGAAAVVTDFATGPGGDVVDVSSVQFVDFPEGENPFTAGYLRLVQSGTSTVLQVNNDGAGSDWVDLLVLRNTTATAFALGNFSINGELFGPTGVGLTLSGGDVSTAVSGTRDDDTIVGGASAEGLYGSGGDDSVTGGGGGDNIGGGAGNDTLAGNAGDDYASGDLGNDRISGDEGNDQLYGGAGNDTLLGGAGDDYVYDYEGTNVIDLGDGDDGIDYVGYGFDATAGADTITLGAGRDTVYLDDNRLDYAGVGVDRITDFAAGVNGDVIRLDALNLQNLASGQNPFATGHIRVVAADLDGDGTLDDAVFQVDRNGSAGGASFTTILAMDGVSPASLRAQNFLYRGAFIDPFPATNVAPVQSVPFYGTVVVDETNTVGEQYGLLRDTVDGDGNALTVSIPTQPSGGTVSLVDPTTGEVELSGFAAAGTYTFTYAISDGTTSVTRTGTIRVLPDASTGISVPLSESDDLFYGTNGADTLNGLGGDDQLTTFGGNDSVAGGAGDDLISAGEGNDTIAAGDGDDFVAYSAGSDSISGGAGNDTLQLYNGTHTVDAGTGDDVISYVSYGAGVDTVTGGAGRDVYELDLASAEAADIVTDFTAGAGGDVIRLTYPSNTIPAGVNPFTGGYLRLIQSGANTLLQLDANGGGSNYATVLVLRNTTASSVTAANFEILDYYGDVAPGLGFPLTGTTNTINSDNYGRVVGGTNGNDVINADTTPTGGAGGDDTVRGYLGNDTVNAGAGADDVAGGYGSDSLVGNDGDDRLVGGEDNDTLDGGFGEDSLYGGNGADTLRGGADDDYLQGDAGADSLDGGTGNDYLSASDDADTLIGGTGNDTIDADAADAVVDGGAGNDNIRYIGYRGGQRITLGAGVDDVEIDVGYAASSGIAPARITDFVAGASGDILELYGLNSFTGFDDTRDNPFLTGHIRLVAADLDGDGAADDTALRIDLDGSAGGGAAVTVLELLNVLPGAFRAQNFLDPNYGGPYWSPNGVGAVITGTNGDENGTWNPSLRGSFDGDTISGLGGADIIDGDSGNDSISGGDASDTLYGNWGDDTVDGDDGDDQLRGGDGSDTVRGGEGDDTLDGEAGDDSLAGGDGDDYLADYRGFTVANGGAGADTFEYVSYSPEGGRYTGGTGRDAFNVSGHAFYYESIGSSTEYTAGAITDFEGGAAGDVLDVSEWAGYLSGWDPATNPFSGGYVRWRAVDGDGDGAADDLALQADADGTGTAYSFATGVVLLNTTLAAIEPTNVVFAGGRSWSFTGGNALPVANNDSFSTDEDTALVVPLASSVLRNDRDPEGSSLTAVLAVGPSNGTLTFNSNGTFTYTPFANFSGTDSFTYRANDGTNSGRTATVTIEVRPENDAPDANPDVYSLVEGTTLTTTAANDVLNNDVDGDRDALTAELVTGTSHGTLTLNADGTFTYTPTNGFVGTDSFTYRANDGTTTSAPTTVTLNVTSGNVEPVGNADSYSVAEDGRLTVAGPGVLGNDTDADGDTLTAGLISGPNVGTDGSFTLNPDGSFTYVPPSNFSGQTQFSYRPSDGTANGNVTTVTITVTPVNDAPVADADGPYSATEDTTLTVSAAAGVLSGDTDADNDPLTAVLVTGPAHGTLTLNANGSFSYTPGANFSGEDSFVYRASDGTATSAPRTVIINVAPENDDPVADNDAYSLNEDQLLEITSPANGVLNGDTDADNDPLTVSLVTGPTHGTLSLNANGTFEYAPTANYNGTDTFTYRVSDGKGGTDTATVTLTVGAVNDVPDARNDSYDAVEDQTLTVTAAAGVLNNDTDVDLDSLAVSLVDGVDHGTLTLNANGSFTYRGATNYNGTDSFTYSVSDGKGGTDTATVTLNVGAVNDAPVAGDDTISGTANTPVTVSTASLLANDSDIDGGTLRITAVGGASNGSVALDDNGTATTADDRIVFTPATGFVGTAGFTYTVSDGAGGTDTARVDVVIGATPNRAPFAGDDTYAAVEDQTLTVTAAAGVLVNDTDADGDSLAVSLVDGVDHGTLTLNANGSFTYRGATDYNGTDTFTYSVSDGKGGTDTATVTLTVGAVNDVPDARNDSYDAVEDQTLTVTAAAGVLNNDTDVDLDSLSVSLVDGVDHGTLTLNANGSFTYRGATNYNGTDSFTYSVSDGKGGTDTATVTLNVGAVNDAPVAGDDTISGTANTPVTVSTASLLANDSDIDGGTLRITAVGGASNGSVSLDDNGTATTADDRIVFTPATGFVGTAGFTYTVSDGAGGTDTARVDVVIGSPSGPVINGTSGRDVLSGTNAAEQINGFDGSDILRGLGGNDTLDGGTGNDTLRGGEGLDSLRGGEGTDNLYGDAGNDALFGDAGNDRVDGGEGNDSVFGGAGTDKVYGGLGADTLNGGDGNDKITAGIPDLRSPDGSADLLLFDAADGTDTVFGFGLGEDEIALTDGGSYTLKYTSGGNTVLRYGSTEVTIYDVRLTDADIVVL